MCAAQLTRPYERIQGLCKFEHAWTQAAAGDVLLCPSAGLARGSLSGTKRLSLPLPQSLSDCTRL